MLNSDSPLLSLKPPGTGSRETNTQLQLRVIRQARNNLNFGFSYFFFFPKIPLNLLGVRQKNLSSCFSPENINLTVKFNELRGNQFPVKTNWNQIKQDK